MNYFAKLISRILPRQLPTPVGRWKIDHCNIKTNRRIDQSNEDHCGPCGQFVPPIIIQKPEVLKK